MKNKRLLDRLPSVIVTSKRNELKVYQDNTVYLNNGDNFELNFFNPLQEKLGIEIIFNGIKKGDSYLIINPGQDIFLDRFLDEQRKMLFETYVINGDNKESIEAAEKNGLITFNFYREFYKSNSMTDVNIKNVFPTKPSNNWNNWNGIISTGTGGYSSTISSSTISGNFNTTTCSTTIYNNYTNNKKFRSKLGETGNNGPIGTCGTNEPNMTYDSIFTCSTNFSDTNTLNMSNICNTSSFNPVETGRIEKGEISNQLLKNVNVNFAHSPFHSISYKLMPFSAKAQSINEIREYCCECGYRLRKSSWKFCPKCGNKI